MSWTETLSFPFMQHAILAVLFAGIAFPMIGVFIISLHLIPLRFAMMHIALLGGAIGLFLKIDPMFSGMFLCAISSLALGPISEKTKLGVGTISGYFMALTLALAFILIYKADIHVIQAFNILWGNVLSLSRVDLLFVMATSLIILCIVILFFKEIQAILYDREVALAVGIPEKVFYFLIIFMLGLTIAISMRMIGALLIDAFVLLPAMAATLISRSLKQTFFLSSLFGLLSGMIGLYFSFVFDLPASSTVIIVSSLIIILCFLIQRRTAMQKIKKIFTGQGVNALILLVGGILLLNLPSPALAQEGVVASTSLTGAIARAAGAKEMRIIASSEMKHPPEYDLKPSDLLKFEGAKVVIYAGYERMVGKLLETSKNKNILAIQVDTTTSPENLITQVRKISKILKTENEGQAWEEGFSEKLKALKKRIASLSGRHAVVHRFAQPFAQWAGLSILQVIQPGELTSRAISDAIGKNPELVVDILHFPNAKVIAENARCKYIQVINFPGVENTKTIEDLFEYNCTQLLKVFQ
ncbi:MAG: metal ABC transporter permease [Thermodesulfobacteriota bacterium]|nr:metal ABC transporter permease [Thermodesulfobacteriota bacterium]